MRCAPNNARCVPRQCRVLMHCVSRQHKVRIPTMQRGHWCDRNAQRRAHKAQGRRVRGEAWLRPAGPAVHGLCCGGPHEASLEPPPPPPRRERAADPRGVTRETAAESSRKTYVGVGVGALEPLLQTPRPQEGAPGAGSLLSMVFTHLHNPKSKAPVQQGQDTKRQVCSLKTIEPHRSTTFRHFRRPERGAGGRGRLCLVNMHCPPPL